jgi:hypothetical protein
MHVVPNVDGVEFGFSHECANNYSVKNVSRRILRGFHYESSAS